MQGTSEARAVKKGAARFDDLAFVFEATLFTASSSAQPEPGDFEAKPLEFSVLLATPGAADVTLGS